MTPSLNEGLAGSVTERRTRPNFATSLMSQGQFRLLPMIIVLITVWVVLQLLTDGLFLSARNLTNLSGQVAITAVLAAGAVMVMVPGYIDLSLGATVAASAVVAAYASTVFHFPLGATVAITLAFGLVVGLWHALVMISAMPRIASRLASVTINAGTPIQAIQKACQRPTTKPNASVIATVAPKGK